MSLRASAVRTSRRPDARRAPSKPTRRTCRTGSHATTSRDQNLILGGTGTGSLRFRLPKTFTRHSNEAERDGDDQKGKLLPVGLRLPVVLYCFQWYLQEEMKWDQGSELPAAPGERGVCGRRRTLYCLRVAAQPLKTVVAAGKRRALLNIHDAWGRTCQPHECGIAECVYVCSTFQKIIIILMTILVLNKINIKKYFVFQKNSESNTSFSQVKLTFV